MSGMYVRQGLSGISVTDIPFIGRAVAWGDATIQKAVENIIRRYAEFERAAMEAPAIAQDAGRVLQVIQETGGTPEQVSQAMAYEREAQRLAAEASNRGPVDQVVQWVEGLRRGTGMGALPAIPVYVIAAASVATIVVANTIKHYNQAKLVRNLIAAGMTPEQIAKIGTGRSPFSVGLFGATSALSLVLLAAGGYLLYRVARG
jgi:hypothetical protein